MRKKLLVLGAASLYTWVVAWQHIQATRLGYRVASALDAESSILGRIAYLRLSLAHKGAPPEIARRAESRLGMRPPDTSSLLVVRTP